MQHEKKIKKYKEREKEMKKSSKSIGPDLVQQNGRHYIILKQQNGRRFILVEIYGCLEVK